MTRGQKKNLALMVRGTLESRLNEAMLEYEGLRRRYHDAQFRNDPWTVRNCRHLIRQAITRVRLARYTLDAARPDHLNDRAFKVTAPRTPRTPLEQFNALVFHRPVTDARD